MFGGCIDRGRGPMTSADEIRDVQRATWAGLSAAGRSGTRSSWISSARSAQRSSTVSTSPKIISISTSPRTGEPGLSIAGLSPKGRVVLTDLVAEMLDIAARRARAQGVANIETTVSSADDFCRSTTPHSIASPCVLGVLP